jgi:hypothetical protein
MEPWISQSEEVSIRTHGQTASSVWYVLLPKRDLTGNDTSNYDY